MVAPWLRSGCERGPAPDGSPDRCYSAGRKTGNLTHISNDETPPCHQSQDRQSPGSHDPVRPPHPRRRGDRVRRRDFLPLIGGAAALPLAGRAQQRAMAVIGVLHGVSAAQWKDRMVGFHRGLGEAGFAEGQTISIEYRWAEGQFERLPTMAADLVGRNVAVICAGASDIAIRAAIEATSTIPIVFTTASDPVRAGFVHTLHRPGRNVTGATFMGVELVAKRLELLNELLPSAP